MDDMVKIYKVTFNQYTNSFRDTVSSKDNEKYLDVGRGDFLIREDDMEYYKQFGDGFACLELVGYMPVEDNE